MRRRFATSGRLSIRTLRNSSSTAGSVCTISVTRVIADRRTPWFRSVRRFLAFVVKWSAKSGTFFITRSAHRAAYVIGVFRMPTSNYPWKQYTPSSEYMYYLNPTASQSRWLNLETSPQMLYWQKYKAQARPRTYWSGSCRCVIREEGFNSIGRLAYFFNELVTKVRTSWLSSSSSMIPR